MSFFHTKDDFTLYKVWGSMDGLKYRLIAQTESHKKALDALNEFPAVAYMEEIVCDWRGEVLTNEEVESVDNRVSEEICAECSDHIYECDPRYRLPSGVYHQDCYEEKVAHDQEVIKKAAESMGFDQRVTA